MKCPYCGSGNCSKTILGGVETVGAFVASAGAGFIGKAAIGMLTGGRYTPSRINTAPIRKEIPKQYKCEKCGRTFHEQD